MLPSSMHSQMLNLQSKTLLTKRESKQGHILANKLHKQFGLTIQILQKVCTN